MKVLLADDEKAIAVTLGDALRAAGHDVTVVNDGLAAAAAVDASPFDVVVSDIRMPGLDGMAVLGKAKARDPRTEVILVTGYGTVESAVEAMKAGAFHYVQKPFYNEAIVELLGRIAHLRSLRPREEEPVAMEGIVGASREMRQVFDVLRRAAPSEASILIEGESGTGKEMVARAIHNLSPRRSGPFVPISCAAIPETLLESELFGHERGAFTDAKERKIGRFERANGGTVFLDDVDDMPLAMQVKLLRVLQEREIERLGGVKPIPVSVRVVTATKVDLQDAVQEGAFREDLYWRLNVVGILLPPLRERGGDVRALTEHFLGLYGRGRKFTVPPDVLADMEAYFWPGNVRELENAVERAIALAGPGGALEREHLLRSRGDRPAPGPAGGTVRTLREAGAAAEKDAILAALRLTQGHRARAAKVLGISRKSLWEKMRQHGIEDPPAGGGGGGHHPHHAW
ncbi:MAG: sigma-54 dependent transcriptional regulator [Planctomycetes bacterium]|nr:sigma-54 dependent transcriptional regulator [Planctomycetota bacterium]